MTWCCQLALCGSSFGHMQLRRHRRHAATRHGVGVRSVPDAFIEEVEPPGADAGLIAA
jgi:hypothetical protein